MSSIYVAHLGDHRYRYVGQTATRFTARVSSHYSQAKAGNKQPIYNFLRKHGKRVVFEVIETTDDLDNREKFWIATLREQGHSLLNCTDGGSRGQVFSDETRAKMSLARSMQVRTPEHISALHAGRDAWMKSPEGREIMQSRMAGENNPNYGVPWTPERRRKTMAARTSRLSEDDVRAIRKSASEGVMLKTIAEQYEMNPATISRIISRQRWAHVD